MAGDFHDRGAVDRGNGSVQRKLADSQEIVRLLDKCGKIGPERRRTMRVNPKALLVSVAFYLLVATALASHSGWAPATETTASVLILLSLAGLMRDGHRPM